MKRFFSLTLLCVSVLLLTPRLSAQNGAAEREHAEERYRSMSASLANLEETMVSYQTRMNEMRQLINRLQDEIDRLKNKNELASSGVQDSLKRLQDSVLEVDKKRMSDNDKTFKAMAELEDRTKKLLLERPAPRPTPTPPAIKPDPSPKPPVPEPNHDTTPTRESGYEYAIRDRDTLSGLVVLLRGQGLKITQKILMEANPNVNWNRLRVGQKIFIPAPTP